MKKVDWKMSKPYKLFREKNRSIFHLTSLLLRIHTKLMMHSSYKDEKLWSYILIFHRENHNNTHTQRRKRHKGHNFAKATQKSCNIQQVHGNFFILMRFQWSFCCSNWLNDLKSSRFYIQPIRIYPTSYAGTYIVLHVQLFSTRLTLLVVIWPAVP